jgi:hypothetical protein
VTVSISLVLVLGAAVWLMHRYAGLRFVHALVCFLFGFLIAATGAAPAIRHMMASLISVLSGQR